MKKNKKSKRLENPTKYGFIYKVTNIKTKKSYIGLTIRTVKARWASHCYSANSLSLPGSLAKAIEKYGHRNFKVITLGRYPISDLPIQERKFIAKHKTLTPNGYNRHIGGSMAGEYGKEVIVKGQKFKSLSAASRHYGVEADVTKQRIKIGWTLHEALEIVEKIDKFKPIPVKIGRKKFKSISSASLAYNLPAGTVQNRLKLGWSPEQALGISPPPAYRPKGRQIKVSGKIFKSISFASDHFGICRHRVLERLSAGWTIEESFEISQHNPKNQKSISVKGRNFPTLKSAAKYLGISYGTFLRRLKCGWTVDQASGIRPPPKIRIKNAKKISINGLNFDSISEAATHFNLSKPLVISRLGHGWTIYEALGQVPRKNPNLQPVTVFGKSYTSIKDTFANLQVSEQSVRNLVKNGFSKTRAFEIALEKKEMTRQMQSITYKGVQYRSKAHLSRALGISKTLLWGRLKSGWPIEEATGSVARQRRRANSKPVRIAGLKFPSISEASRHFAHDPDTVIARITNGWTVRDALLTPKLLTKHNSVKVKVKGRIFESIAAAAKHFGVPETCARKRIYKGWKISRACSMPARKKRSSKVANYVDSRKS